VHPNDGFITQLRLFEKQMRSSPSKSDIAQAHDREERVGRSSPQRYYDYYYKKQYEPITNPEQYYFQRHLTPGYRGCLSPAHKSPTMDGGYTGMHECFGRKWAQELLSNYQSRNKDILYDTRSKDPCY
jgi:hypothetical protein